MIKRLENGNIELTFTLPWEIIAKRREKLIDEAVANAEIPGFRKGKAPRKSVEDKLDKGQLLSKAVSAELPDAYTRTVDEQELKPVLYPKIQIQKGEEGKDWEILAVTCEAPDVTLPDLSKTVGKIDMKKIMETATVKLSNLIIEAEANHRLTQLADNLTSLGMDVNKYLDSKKITLEDLKAKTTAEAKRDLQTEFILQKIQVGLKLKTRQETLDRMTNIV